MDIVIKWQDKEGNWQPFDVNDILHMSRNHAIALFSQGTGVIIKQGDSSYIVNRVDLLDQYKRQGKSVKLLSQCEGSDKTLEEVGL